MYKKLFYISAILTIILIIFCIAHWRFISLKYTWQYTPPLSCDILRIAYATRFEPEFKPIDAYFVAHPDGADMPPEISRLMRKLDTVQQTSLQIQQLCDKNFE